MKKVLTSDTKPFQTDLALLIGRITVALLMLTHGLPKLQHLLSSEAVQFPSVFGLSPEISLTFAVLTEVVCSIFILFGYATRLATIPLIITMAVAAFSIHAADPLSKREPALLYLLIYTILFFKGSGRYSLSYFVHNRAVSREYAMRGINKN